MTLPRWLRRTLATLATLAALALLLAAFAGWLLVRPMQGEWTADVPLWRGGPAVKVSVPRVIELATDPQWAPHLHGRTLDTRAGTLVLRWDAGSRSLTAQCAPCALHLAALGGVPLRLRQGELSLRRDEGPRYSGRLASGEVVLTWRGTLAPSGMSLQGDLGPRPLAPLLALFGDAVPEARRARIEGTLVGRWRAELPAGTTSVLPVVTGFEVSGLGTEALANAAPPARCVVTGRRRPPSPLLAQAVVAAEDQRFFEHPGFDVFELLAAFELNQREAAVKRGASTLTQQLAKILYTGDERSAARKLRELLYAVEMERTLGKQRILQLYLAVAPWGPVCGAEFAARFHVGRTADKLDAVEAAYLAALLRQPEAPVDRARLLAVVRAMPALNRAQRRDRLEAAERYTPPAPGSVDFSAAPGAASRSSPSPRRSASPP